jgi:hypothetical protein
VLTACSHGIRRRFLRISWDRLSDRARHYSGSSDHSLGAFLGDWVSLCLSDEDGYRYFTLSYRIMQFSCAVVFVHQYYICLSRPTGLSICCIWPYASSELSNKQTGTYVATPCAALTSSGKPASETIEMLHFVVEQREFLRTAGSEMPPLRLVALVLCCMRVQLALRDREPGGRVAFLTLR